MVASKVLDVDCGGCIWRPGASEGPSAPEAVQEDLSILRCVKRGATFYVWSWKEGSSWGTGTERSEVPGP